MRLIDADALWHNMETADWYNNADRDEVAEPLVLRSPTIGGWISVEDKLPDKSNRYLVYFGKGIGTTTKTAYWLRTKQKWMGSEAHSTITDITHWMPLPEPPKEEKQ